MRVDMRSAIVRLRRVSVTFRDSSRYGRTRAEGRAGEGCQENGSARIPKGAKVRQRVPKDATWHPLKCAWNFQGFCQRVPKGANTVTPLRPGGMSTSCTGEVPKRGGPGRTGGPGPRAARGGRSGGELVRVIGSAAVGAMGAGQGRTGIPVRV